MFLSLVGLLVILFKFFQTLGVFEFLEKRFTNKVYYYNKAEL